MGGEVRVVGGVGSAMEGGRKKRVGGRGEGEKEKREKGKRKGKRGFAGVDV